MQGIDTQRQSKTVNSRAMAWHSADVHSNGKAE
nr:MAG TPA: hypothetical protein [Caudoviricetes sp.]